MKGLELAIRGASPNENAHLGRDLQSRPKGDIHRWASVAGLLSQCCHSIDLKDDPGYVLAEDGALQEVRMWRQGQRDRYTPIMTKPALWRMICGVTGSSKQPVFQWMAPQPAQQNPDGNKKGPRHTMTRACKAERCASGAACLKERRYRLIRTRHVKTQGLRGPVGAGDLKRHGV